MKERIPREACDLLDGPNVGHLATLMPDGSPQTTPVWVDREGDVVVINIAKGRVKYANMCRDQRVALSVHDRNNPLTYVEIRGRASLSEDGAVAHVHKLSRKYLGRPYSEVDSDPPRVIVRILPERAYYYRHD